MTRWSGEHTAILMADYRDKGAAAIAGETGKSETAVRVKACRLGEKRLFHAKTPRGKRLLTPRRTRVETQ